MNYDFWQTSSGRKPVQEIIARLPSKEAEEVLLNIKPLIDFSFQELVRQRYLEKLDKDGLWEYRIDIGHYHYRVYCGIKGQTYILLHFVKKDYRRLKKSDIKLAKHRLRSI